MQTVTFDSGLAAPIFISSNRMYMCVKNMGRMQLS